MGVGVILNSVQIGLLSYIPRVAWNDKLGFHLNSRKRNLFVTHSSTLYTVDFNDNILVIDLHDLLCPILVLQTLGKICNIKELIISPGGLYLAAVSDESLIVLDLSKVSKLRSDDSLFLRSNGAFAPCSARFTCDIIEVVKAFVEIGNGSWRIQKADFHPLSNSHLMILSSDNILRLYNLQDYLQNSQAEQLFNLNKYTGKLRFVSFSFFKSQFACWAALGVFLLTEKGEIFVLCPIIPSGPPLPQRYMNILWDQLKSFNNPDDLATSSFEWITKVENIRISGRVYGEYLLFKKYYEPQIRPVTLFGRSVEDMVLNASDVTAFEYNSLQLLLVTCKSGRLMVIVINQRVLPSQKVKGVNPRPYKWILWDVLEFGIEGMEFNFLSNSRFGYDGEAEKTVLLSESSEGNGDEKLLAEECIYFYSSCGLWAVHIPWVFYLDRINRMDEAVAELPHSNFKLLRGSEILSAIPIECNGKFLGFLLVECVLNRIVECNFFSIKNEEFRRSSLVEQLLRIEGDGEGKVSRGFEEAANFDRVQPPMDKDTIPEAIRGPLHEIKGNRRDMKQLADFLVTYCNGVSEFNSKIMDFQFYGAHVNFAGGKAGDIIILYRQKIEDAITKAKELKVRTDFCVEKQQKLKVRIHRIFEMLDQIKKMKETRDCVALIEGLEADIKRICKELETIERHFGHIKFDQKEGGRIASELKNLIILGVKDPRVRQLVEFIKFFDTKVKMLQDSLISRG